MRCRDTVLQYYTLHKGGGETTARADTDTTFGKSECANVRCLSVEQHLLVWVTPSSRLRQEDTRAPLACNGPHSSFLLMLTKPSLVVNELLIHALRVVINMQKTVVMRKRRIQSGSKSGEHLQVEKK